MTQPAGWHPDPEGAPQLRYWDGQQWTSATQPMPAITPTPQPETPAQAKDRKRQLIAIAVAIVGFLAIFGISKLDFGGDDTETVAAKTTTTEAAATTTTKHTPSPRPMTVPPVIRPTTTPAAPKTTTASKPVGCREAPAEYLDVINASFIDGYSFGEVKAVQKGEFWYIAGQIHNAEGGIRSRDDLFVAKDMFVTPVTVTARNQSTLPDLRKVLDVSFSDPAATAALDCARTY